MKQTLCTEKKTNGFSPKTYERICMSMVHEGRCTGASGTNANDAYDVAHGCVDTEKKTNGFSPKTYERICMSMVREGRRRA